MSIDYGRLRAEIDRFDNGDDHDNYKADEWLYLNKSAIARELLRLRDGVGDLLNVMSYYCSTLHKDHYPLTKKYLATYADKITVLLNGDTE